MESALSVHYHVLFWTDFHAYINKLKGQIIYDFTNDCSYISKSCKYSHSFIYSNYVIHHSSDTVFVKKNIQYTFNCSLIKIMFLEINRVVVLLKKTLTIFKVVCNLFDQWIKSSLERGEITLADGLEQFEIKRTRIKILSLLHLFF